MAGRPWHPCTDALDHVVEALDRLVDVNRDDTLIDRAQLHELIQYQSTCPSRELSRAIDGPSTSSARYGDRVEMARRWLQTNAFVADSTEFIHRIRGVQTRLQKWEETARERVAWNTGDILHRGNKEPRHTPSPIDWFGQDTREALDEILDEAAESQTYVRQLAATIRAKLDAKPAAGPPSDPPPGETGEFTEPRPDGVYPPRTIVFGGVEHDCELTTQEIAFLRVALPNAETDIGLPMHGGNGAVWQEAYVTSKRNKVSQLITRLNRKLLGASPSLRILFSLRRGLPFVSRDEGPTQDANGHAVQ